MSWYVFDLSLHTCTVKVVGPGWAFAVLFDSGAVPFRLATSKRKSLSIDCTKQFNYDSSVP